MLHTKTYKNLILGILLFFAFEPFYNVQAQSQLDSLNANYKSEIALHPLGIFMSRINHNFQFTADAKKSISVQVSSGNVWLPKVNAYQLLNKEDVNYFQKLAWHEKAGPFDAANMPAKSIALEADGVIRSYQIAFNFPITTKQEFKINTRFYSLDNGKIPYSLFTSDQFIEWFHSNVAGGEDPFARKDYGLNKSKIQFKDENDQTFEMNNGDFIFSGIELSYYYYPTINYLKNHLLFTNIGLNFGLNTTKINPSFDLGINGSIIKKININPKQQLQFGGSLGLLRTKILKYGNGIQLHNNKFLFSSELSVNYIKTIGKNRLFTIGTSYFIQSPYNKKSDFDSIIIVGERITTHWHYAMSHLYRPLTANNFNITFVTKKLCLSAYFREDFLVDNAPDSQVGIGIKIFFN